MSLLAHLFCFLILFLWFLLLLHRLLLQFGRFCLLFLFLSFLFDLVNYAQRIFFLLFNILINLCTLNCFRSLLLLPVLLRHLAPLLLLILRVIRSLLSSLQRSRCQSSIKQFFATFSSGSRCLVYRAW